MGMDDAFTVRYIYIYICWLDPKPKILVECFIFLASRGPAVKEEKFQLFRRLVEETELDPEAAGTL